MRSGAAGVRLQLGIGDDAAILGLQGRTDLVLTCDAFLEGSHFLADVHPADSVGYKALARATSDLAGMGAVPRVFLLTLALPAIRTGAWLDGFLRGMGRAARETGLQLAGGDTSKAKTVSIVITVVGELIPGQVVLRSGAQPRDTIYVSGRLGRAQLGLELVRNGLMSRTRTGRVEREALQHHLYPRTQIALGEWLARHRIASAMMDISDGLSTDLNRLCAASRVGARIWAERVPCVEIPQGPRGLRQFKLEPLKMALDGGDDYELLFTVPRRREHQLKTAPGYKNLRAIGEITSGKRVELVGVDGRIEPLAPGGWDPFRKSSSQR